jgi:hypothetical protein
MANIKKKHKGQTKIYKTAYNSDYPYGIFKLFLKYKFTCVDSMYIIILIYTIQRNPWRVSLVERELLNLQVHLSSPPVFCGVRVTQSLVLYVLCPCNN